MTNNHNKPPRRDERRRARERKRCPDRLAKKMTPSGATQGVIIVALPPKQKPLSTRKYFKAFSMMAVKFCRHNSRKPNGPVRKNTCYQAYATPYDMRGFVAPKFHDCLNFQAVDRCLNSDIGMVYGRGGGYRQRHPHGLVHVLNHHAHQQRVRTLRVVSQVHQGTKTMQLATTAMRPSAHPAPSAYTHTDHAGDFNRDVLAVGNAENAISRVLFELRKPQPDNARALKLAQSAMLAIHLVGEVLQ